MQSPSKSSARFNEIETKSAKVNAGELVSSYWSRAVCQDKPRVRAAAEEEGATR